MRSLAVVKALLDLTTFELEQTAGLVLQLQLLDFKWGSFKGLDIFN